MDFDRIRADLLLSVEHPYLVSALRTCAVAAHGISRSITYWMRATEPIVEVGQLVVEFDHAVIDVTGMTPHLDVE